MVAFESLSHKIFDWLTSTNGRLSLEGTTPSEFGFILRQSLFTDAGPLSRHHLVLVCPDPETAETLHGELESHVSNLVPVLLFRGLEANPYSGIWPSESNLFKRFGILDWIGRAQSPHAPSIILCDVEALQLMVPSPSFFSSHGITIRISDIRPPRELSEELVRLGYRSSSSVEEPGTFCIKGEIVDIFPNSIQQAQHTRPVPIRLHYFDDMIEEIFDIDPLTQKTNRDCARDSVHVGVTPHLFSNPTFSSQLRSAIPIPSPQFKKRFENRKRTFERLSEGQLFDDYTSFVPLFLSESSTLLDHFSPSKTLVVLIDADKGKRIWADTFEQLQENYAGHQQDTDDDSILPAPDRLYAPTYNPRLSQYRQLETSGLSVDVQLEDDPYRHRICLSLSPAMDFFKQKIGPNTTDRAAFISQSLRYLREHHLERGTLMVVGKTNESINEIRYVMTQNGFDEPTLARIPFILHELSEGFYYKTENLLVLSDADLFSHKKSKAKRQKAITTDLFAEQLATLKRGDYIIHKDYGIGVYGGLENLNVGDTSTDFLVLIYEDNDKIYLPVYKMGLVQKYADQASEVKIADLKTKRFDGAKTRARESAKKLAFDLIQLQAERETAKSFAFSAPDHDFNEFELAFPFDETQDQTTAIHDVIDDMQKERPMDRLVCGDVGFGKTEVAMRAAMLAVLDRKQVCILVPTTILALQHYHSFSRRFKDFPIVIEFLSRFKSAADSKVIKEKVKEGKIDIIIGTHKLLANDMDFKDLGLVIVDEEQRFGVGHKEKLKLLKSTVDFLTLTATPIPRTLQLAFLGLRDLSLIQTPPPRRQAIKSYLIREDAQTIQTAIEKELTRGGQVFFVHNRVSDIDTLAAKIQRWVPRAKIVVAHGQLTERELETKMNAFYQGEYDVLVSTTIIESGLDIPRANTMIVNRADTFGLSQLHQLRGRIGRSERKAYAYFVIPAERALSDIAERRLEALQMYADLGSGFSIASSDLEIRGAGDILGAEQSGQIEAVGLELYMDLLKEAVAEIKGEAKLIRKDVEIQISDPAYIPGHYISDASIRLKYYKTLGNTDSIDSLNERVREIEDIFGRCPVELRNLIAMLETRLILQRCAITHLKTSGRTCSLKFDKSILDRDAKLRERIVSTFIARPRTYKLNPDYSMICTLATPLSAVDLPSFSKSVAEQIQIC